MAHPLLFNYEWSIDLHGEGCQSGKARIIDSAYAEIPNEEETHMKLLKKLLIPVVVLAMTVTTFGVAQASTATVKIGNIIPLSGPSASVGIQGKQAREMALEEINSSGGIKSLGGAKLELLFADSKSDPTTGVTEAERMINTEKVHLLTGC